MGEFIMVSLHRTPWKVARDGTDFVVAQILWCSEYMTEKREHKLVYWVVGISSHIHANDRERAEDVARGELQARGMIDRENERWELDGEVNTGVNDEYIPAYSLEWISWEEASKRAKNGKYTEV
jgi:hypothetical protein